MRGLALFLLLLVACTPVYEYEVCNKDCNRFQLKNVAQPSTKTERLCHPDAQEAIKSGARSVCEDVPINLLLNKGGTDKKYCNEAPYLESDYVDNWWNSEGLIDECEMPTNSNMQFIFKMVDSSTRTYTGTIQIKIDAISYDNDGKALQIFTGEDDGNLPKEWVYCGNVDGINGKTTRYILCKGENLKFIKLVHASWSKGSIFLDKVEVLRT